MVPLDTGTGSSFVEVGDWNGDGALDLAVAPNLGVTLAVLLGDGAGGFSPPVAYACSIFCADLAAGDVNGDGVTDLITSSLESADLAVLLGDGAGGFAAPLAVTAWSAPAGLALGDLDDDGHPDLVVGRSSGLEVLVLLGDGSGGFRTGTAHTVGATPRTPVPGDIDGDGDLDLLAAGATGAGLITAYGNDDGTLVGAPVDTSLHPVDVAITDLDTDGVLDIALIDGVTDEVVVLRGSGGGGFDAPVHSAIGAVPSDFAIADLDADGTPDFAVSCRATDRLRTMIGAGDGSFAPAEALATGDIPVEVVAADFDGDGATDLGVACQGFTTAFSSFPGALAAVDDAYAPNGSCAAAAAAPPGTTNGLVAVRDADGDFWTVVVPAGDQLEAFVSFEHDAGDVDAYLYDTSLAGCGDGASFVDGSSGAGDFEWIVHTNATGAAKTFALHVVLQPGTPGDPACTDYDLFVDVRRPSIGVLTCSGAGIFADCPCGNGTLDPLAGCVNSTGVGARISATGSDVLADDDVVFALDDARANQTAVLIQGGSLIALPFRDGILCTGGPTERLRFAATDAAGHAESSGSIVADGNLMPGQQRWYQWWFRDPGASVCGSGSNLSNAVEVSWQ